MGVANTMDEGMNINTVRNDTSKFTFHIRSILQFANSTDNKDDNGLLFGWKYYHNDDHSSVAHITVYDALRFLFSWYAIQGLDQFYDPSLNTTTEELINFISSHFEKISALYGFRVLPRELFINYIGYELLNNNMPDKAYAMFNLNIQNYPNSANVFDSMGDYYLSQSDTLNAIEHFTKALEIGDIPMSKRKLDKLKNDE